MIDPRNLTWQEWASGVVSSLNTAWNLGTPSSEQYWQDYAVGLVRAPFLAQRSLPDPYAFSDWREWATRSYPMLEGLG